jgi:uncharacterized protein (DUF2236 family)
MMTGTVEGGAGRDSPHPARDDALDRTDGVVIGALPHEDEDAETGEHELIAPRGLFGPGSVTWRIHSDPLVGLAALRSLVLQVLHPDGLTSVFATARRVDDPWDRLSWTLRHLGVTTYGSGAEVAVAGARMRAVLMQVGGINEDGEAFRGDDPDLLLWQHCCQVASLVEVTRRGGLDLSDADHERYIYEQRRAAVVLGLEPDVVPSSRRDLTRYFRATRPRLRMTATGRSFIGAVVAPAVPDLMALAQRNRPAWAPVAGLAFGALPPWARRLYTSAPRTGPAALSQSAVTVALHSLRDSLSGRPANLGPA